MKLTIIADHKGEIDMAEKSENHIRRLFGSAHFDS